MVRSTQRLTPVSIASTRPHTAQVTTLATPTLQRSRCTAPSPGSSTSKSTCEPTTHRLAKKYREPTTHRLLEGLGEPPLLAAELSVPQAPADKCRSLARFPVAVPLVGPTAKKAGNSGLSVVFPVRYQPTGRPWHCRTKPSCAARRAVGADTNLHDALSVPDAGS